MTQYATIEQFKDYLHITDTLSAGEESMVDLALTNASATVDLQTHRTFAAEEEATRFLDAISDVEGRRLWLGADLAQLTTVVNGDGNNVPLSAVVTEPSDATPYFAITLKRSSGLAWTYDEDAEGAIAVTGYWAFSVTPPDPIVQATLRLAAWYYRQRENALDLDRAVIVGNATIAPSRIPADVMTLLGPYMRVVS